LQFKRGLITDDERYTQTVDLWTEATEEVTAATMKSFDALHPVFMMANSGARGNIQQIRQLAGMRGLMADPTGRIIDLPIKANFSEGLTVLEYFISTHGARKGLADTALRTADSGYLTRRLVDVAQDVIVRSEDCGTTSGIWVTEITEERALTEPLFERIAGRVAAAEVQDPTTQAVLVKEGAEISDIQARNLIHAGVAQVKVRSVLTCQAREGVCRLCYGRNLATGKLVEIGEAVGVIAAQSIGEPGTQLTMRTFHTGGVAGTDITQGLPRVEELFEARIPKGKSIISEIDGEVTIEKSETGQLKVKVTQLVSKKAEAEITADLEAKSAPTEFRVLESASAPAMPGSPNRPQMLLLALLAALALGSAVAVGQELSDRTLRSEGEAVALALPVLATVPRLHRAGAGRVLALPAMQGEQG